jgi:hypothetical protein
MQKESWDAFIERMKTVYWPSLPPSMRVEARPDKAEGEPDVPGDIWVAATTVFPDAEAWIHNPIPQARGKTPLELIARGEDDKLREIIQGISGYFLPDPAELRPWSLAEEAKAEGDAADAADAAAGDAEQA